MKGFKRQIGLPLLAKELLELSARKRTYVVRCLYAGLLFVIAYTRIDDILSNYSRDPFAVLGHGKDVFQEIVMLQLAGVFLFMPALACGAITQEKERNSLSLLLITRLSPTTILFEKLLSRLVPMLSFLLLSLPLLGFSYSLGGVTQVELWGSCLLLGLTCVQVGTFALMCSAFCSTTLSAFFSTYLGGLALAFTFGCCLESGGFPIASRLDVVIVTSFLLAASSCVFFIVSHLFLVERALIPPRNVVLEFFKSLDGFFTNLNDRCTGGVILIKDNTSLPGDEPIAWRETAKKSLGTARYLVRVFVAIELPLLIVLVLSSTGFSTTRARGQNNTAPEAMLYIVWVVSILFIAVKTSSLIPNERTHQTYDVLMSTPLTGQEIVMQKLRGVRRLMYVLAVPFISIFLFEAWWNSFFRLSSLNYLFGSLLSIWIYLPLVAWISLCIGMRVRSQAKATLLTLLLLFSWICVPIWLGTIGFLLPLINAWDVYGVTISMLSPAWIVFLIESRQAHFLFILLYFGFYGLLALWFQRLCTNRADRYLGRCGGHEFSEKPSDYPVTVLEAVDA